MRIWPGRSYPLGATYDGSGTNFAIASEAATRVELCLFGDDGSEKRMDLPERAGFVFHGYVPATAPGCRYGFRVHGPWDPAKGHRCNPSKLLLDPYAKAVEGHPRWDEAVYPYSFKEGDLKISTADSAPFMPRSVVTNPFFDWSDDRPPRTPWHETIVYEAHVKGMTEKHPDVPEEIRGKYAGLGSPAIIEHLKKLGVTAIELLPVHQFVHSQHLQDKKLRNYWGYDSICYFAPHNEYASRGQNGQQVQEFKQMVKDLHRAEIEVFLDVVYNHTAEGNQLGPMLSLKGIDNHAYYRTVAKDPRYYMDYTGTGNSLNMRDPYVLQLLMDSLRYWVQEMHIDGFRFDLASTLARGLHDVDRLSAFFDLIQQDPVVSRVKLIAEPWDVGEGGYQVGNFPAQWSEWNGKYRDCVRDYWRGEHSTMGEFAHRLMGSSDLYASAGRTPHASINFVTAHDGFPLRDLVSYNQKHNELNGENNRDGESHNRSWNCGVEGETQDPKVSELRGRQQRNFLATLMLSQGVPMLVAGDEMGRTQKGNNNCYCQDNELSWLNWEQFDDDLLEFTRSLIRLRREHPIFRRRGWFDGRELHGGDVKDLAWFTPDGKEMSDEDWRVGYAKSLAVFLNGSSIRRPGEHGEVVKDDSFYLIFNAHHEPMAFTLPDEKFGDRWLRVLDTAEDTPPELRRSKRSQADSPSAAVKVQARAVVLYRCLG
ncbi:MAG TPA: glycogen debranching protein GlgX [Myxococcales bacterium]|jgi:glycogen operon protein|nr:glycogen debranching protein GlgX [Myxococcales bacterium]